MARIACKVSEGLRKTEASVEIKDHEGRSEFMPVDRDLLHEDNGGYYLPVSLVHLDRQRNLAVIGLPVEADSGANRIWVNLSQLKDVEGIPA
jgi:hypothetical protein